MTTITGKKVAILVAEGFEQVELTDPRKALDEAGAQTRIVSPAKGEVQGWKHFDKADKFKVDVPLEQADANEFDALLLPGGVANPDQLRANPKAVQFVRAFFDAGKPVAAICHGPWTLIEAGAVKGRTITTIKGLGTPEKPHPVQQAYVEEQVPQCGYCVNGWIMTAAALLNANPQATDAQIRDGLAGLKCRCGTHMSIMRAVRRARELMAAT